MVTRAFYHVNLEQITQNARATYREIVCHVSSYSSGATDDMYMVLTSLACCTSGCLLWNGREPEWELKV